MLYFISDTHFNHDKDFIFGPRGFKSIEDQNNFIIEKWNDTVKEDDEVYVLGDFFLGKDMSYIENTLNILNGKIHLIIGNHDTPIKIQLYSEHPKIIELVYSTVIRYKDKTFYLSHYPSITSNLESDPNKAVINIFGHTHSTEKFYENRPYMYNVACDAHNCTPVSIEEIYNEVINAITNYNGKI